jgi:hypothetical protein
MSHSDIINSIKNIIIKFGDFTTADVEANSSPCISSKVGRNELCELFTLYTVEVVTYDKDDFEIDRSFISYEFLSGDVLEDILVLAELHEAQSLQDEDRQTTDYSW